ncbi:MAG: hypothetical protein OHK0022_20950 [Roseiflexaceae bacterium]
MKQETARKNTLIALVTLSVFVLFLAASAVLVSDLGAFLPTGSQATSGTTSLLSALSASVAQCLKGGPQAGNEHGDKKLSGPLAGNEHGDKKRSRPLAGNEHGDKKRSGPLAGNEHGDQRLGILR